MFEKTKAVCDSFLEMGIPGFDLMVCKDGQCVLRYMNGYSDRENKIPMKGDERYNIFSCSKPITCVAAMQLWEKGMFRLEDKLSDYMPEYAEMTVKTEQGIRKAERPIRIHNLFEMTAGFSYVLNSPALMRLKKETDGRCPTREVARALAEEPLLFEPGERYHYSLGHDVLAALVEIWSGQPFATYVKEHIFDPLGMTQSEFLLPVEEYEQVAPLYRGMEDGSIVLHPQGQQPVYRLGTEHASGGAGCVSTVEDYMKFLEALREGEQLIKRDTLRLMITPRLTSAQQDTFTLVTHSYGLGMRVPIEGGRGFDFGWGGAAGAYLAVDLPNNFTMYYAQHVVNSPNHKKRALVYASVLEELTGISISRASSYREVVGKTTY